MSLAVHDYGGEGPDVLLLHGGADNLETWRDLVPLLDGFRVMAFNARGHGQSPTPAAADVDAMVLDVIELAEELERPLLVGHSMGGVNALLAAGTTDRFAGVVALDAVPRWWSRPDLTQAELEEIGASRGLGWSGTEAELSEEIASLAEGSEHVELIRAVFRRNHETNGAGRLRRKPDPGFALRLAEIYQGPESGLTHERIEAARCPVLMLCSQNWVTGEDARRALAALDGVGVEWLDTSHYLHWDEPRTIARRIRELA